MSRLPPGLDLDEDYEANYPDGYRPDPYENSFVPVGLCRNMCTYEEMRERENNGRLSKYEVEANSNPPKVDTKLAIKEFKRSCAGREFTSAVNLRPWSVLKQTLHHLLLNICSRQDDWMFVCDFVFDRLKAVRQDMVVQRIEGSRYVEVLEGSVRFLVYSMYRLTCTLRDYAGTWPLKTIISLEGPVSGLDNYELHVVREMKLTMKSLRDCLNSLIVQYQEKVPDSPNRPLFEAVNLIVNLPFLYGHTIMNSTEFQSKSKLRNSDPMFKTVFKMYRKHLIGDHSGALKQLPKLFDYPLLVLAYAPAIAQLQVHLIEMLKKLYSSPGVNSASLKHMCDFLCPSWLEIDEDKSLIYARFITYQFGLYDENRNVCDFGNRTKDKFTVINSDTKSSSDVQESENETLTFALQMIAGRDWWFYQEALKIHGIEHILNPTQE